jgi:pimeloyl-ACP methyl ester carboxylesterase
MRSSGTPFMKFGFVSRAAMEIHDTLQFKVCKANSYPDHCTNQSEFYQRGRSESQIEARLMDETWSSPDFNLPPKLKTLKMPTLVITGDHEFIPSSTAEHISQAIPNARLLSRMG